MRGIRTRQHTGRERRALAAALAFAHEHGYDSRKTELPCGDRDSSDRCPIALAIDGFVTSTLWWRDGLGPQALPDDVELFATLFDRGRYPELVA